jgi:hypothetical protein
VVSLHWGGNWGYSVPAEQWRFAQQLQILARLATHVADDVRDACLRATLAPLVQHDDQGAEADGSVLIIHARTDDYASQLADAAGDRLACAVMRPG